jgi:MbtH protein
MGLVDDTDVDERRYEIVINDEGQYSMWLADRPVPEGWKPIGVGGTITECSAEIDNLWSDLRPQSLIRLMSEG